MLANEAWVSAMVVGVGAMSSAKPRAPSGEIPKPVLVTNPPFLMAESIIMAVWVCTPPSANVGAGVCLRSDIRDTAPRVTCVQNGPLVIVYIFAYNTPISTAENPGSILVRIRFLGDNRGA